MVAIDCLQKTPGQISFIVPMIREAEQGKLLIVCSTILKVEAFKIRGSTDDPAKQTDLIRGFFQNEYFQFEPPHDWIVEFAQDLCRDFNLNTIDAVHAATAVFTRTPILLTRDGESARRKKLLPLDSKIRHRDPGGAAIANHDSRRIRPDSHEGGESTDGSTWSTMSRSFEARRQQCIAPMRIQSLHTDTVPP